MISSGHNTSSLIPSQLPGFITEESTYKTFVAFMQAYYEWLESANTSNTASNIVSAFSQGALYGSQNLQTYYDVDTTLDEFIQYYLNDFLPYFPIDALADKKKVIKIAKQLYQTKGTPSSYQFLFRALYNSDVDLFMTRDIVLRASDGKWFIPRSLRLKSLIPNEILSSDWLKIDNLRVFGETSKSIATIERTIYATDKIEVFISNVERTFLSGETIKVVDNNNQDVLFTGEPLKAKLVGTISRVDIDAKNRGELYNGYNSITNYPGDPVVLYGGLNTPTGHGAEALVTETTKGSIVSINVQDGGHGYTLTSGTSPSSEVVITGGGGSGATARIITIDPREIANVAFLANNTIATSRFTQIGNTQYSFFTSHPTSNANTSLANAFSFTAFSVSPIGSIQVTNGGGGYSSIPNIDVLTYYSTPVPGFIGNLKDAGILAPIKINTPGINYANGDIIRFTGGTGYGAFANVRVNTTGSIVSAKFIRDPSNLSVPTYPLGGAGYHPDGLPELTVISSNGAGAVLTVPGILGDGAKFSTTTTRIGEVTAITVTDYGEDYIATPNVSLRVQDVVVSNVSLLSFPARGEIVYQGPNINTATYIANVASISLITPDVNPANSLYSLRVYEYTSNPSNTQPLIINRVGYDNIYMKLSEGYDGQGNPKYNYGFRNYGDGSAKAVARFLNGLIIGDGKYINQDGQPSSFSVLQSDKYNNFTYQLTVEESIEKYRNILLNLLHPSGTRVLPRYAVKSTANVDIEKVQSTSNSHSLGFFTGDPGSNAAMYASFAQPSNNIIKFESLVGANLESILYPNAYISIVTDTGPNVYSKVISVTSNGNTAIIQDNVFLAFANVAIANVISSQTHINITSLTGQYDLINNKEYSNTSYPLMDIVYAGDTIRMVSGASNQTATVSGINYIDGIITLNTSATFTSSNAYISIARNIRTNNVHIYNSYGTQYYPQIVTESGVTITTEDDRIILLG
jgi:hypothetical protein